MQLLSSPIRPCHGDVPDRRGAALLDRDITARILYVCLTECEVTLMSDPDSRNLNRTWVWRSKCPNPIPISWKAVGVHWYLALWLIMRVVERSLDYGILLELLNMKTRRQMEETFGELSFSEDCCLLVIVPCSCNGGGSKSLWNVGKILSDCTAQQPRR